MTDNLKKYSAIALGASLGMLAARVAPLNVQAAGLALAAAIVVTVTGCLAYLCYRVARRVKTLAGRPR